MDLIEPPDSYNIYCAVSNLHLFRRLVFSSKGLLISRRPTTLPEPSCEGVTYVVSSSDTCVGISMNEGISTDDLMVQNGLPSFCKYFAAQGTELCIPSYKICKPYTVKSSDTCGSLQREFGIQYAQMIAWNPTLGPKCANIDRHVGYVICVSNPGGDWTNPNPVPPTNSETRSAVSLVTLLRSLLGPSSLLTFSSFRPPLWTRTLTALSSYPKATFVPSTIDAPYANLTRMDCAVYVTAPMLTNYTGNGTTSFACDDVVDAYGTELSDFLSWNPSLNATTPCVMSNHTQYCVQRLSRTVKNITDACVQMDTVPAGYDCMGFTALRGIDVSQFMLWNPPVGDECQDLEVGAQHCVAVRNFRQPGRSNYAESVGLQKIWLLLIHCFFVRYHVQL
jgi:hypothetical protein